MRTTRRTILGQLAAGSGGLALGCGAPPREPATTSAAGGESTGPRARIAHEHEPVPLPFDPSALTGLSERLVTSHHDNNYAGAVRKLNECRRRLAATPPDAPGFVFGGLAKSELVFANSVLLHELYFENLGGDGSDRSRAFDLATAEVFGDAAGWEADLRRCAMSLAGGSGWVVVAWDAYRGELAHRVCSDHGHAGAFDVPLLVLDMYEHSYHLDHGADAARYVDAFMANLRWEVVEARLARAAG